MTTNRISDRSNDRKYFTVVPRVVWALARDPYDLTLWMVVKMVAGEKGECFLSRDQLAGLAMMSAGKVSDCRDYLIDVGLLEGEMRQDPGFPQPVWHLRIPDLWERNIKWAEKNPSLGDRWTWKKEQKSRHHMTARAEPSPHDGTPSPGDGTPSPHDAKKNQKKNQEEEGKIWKKVLDHVKATYYGGNATGSFAHWQACRLVEINEQNGVATIECPEQIAPLMRSRFSRIAGQAFVAVGSPASAVVFREASDGNQPEKAAAA